MRVHPALRLPAPAPLPAPTFAVTVEIAGGTRQTITIAALTPGAARDNACAQLRATGYRGPILIINHRLHPWAP